MVMLRRFTVFLVVPLCAGCTVLTVADAAVSVVATTVKVGATVVETTVDVAAAGVRAATKQPEDSGADKK